MAEPIRITVEGVGGVRLSNDAELERWLGKKGVECLINEEGDEVVGFASLAAGGKYTLGPPQQPRQPPALFTTEETAAIARMAVDYSAKIKTIVLSDATATSKRALLSMFLDMPEKAASWPTMPSTCPEYPVFQWNSSHEDSSENRTSYMKHLAENVRLPGNYIFADVQPIRGLLDVEIRGVDSDSRRIRGTTDVVITTSENVRNKTIRNSFDAQIELKKPKNLANKDHSPQVIAEHFAAAFLNQMRGIVSILTDLTSSWTFYWFADCDDAPGGVALYKHVQEGGAAAAASKYILENFQAVESTSITSTTLPSTLPDRLSFHAILHKLSEVPRPKRSRIGSKPDDMSDDDSSLNQDGDAEARGGNRGASPHSNSGSGGADASESKRIPDKSRKGQQRRWKLCYGSGQRSALTCASLQCRCGR